MEICKAEGSPSVSSRRWPGGGGKASGLRTSGPALTAVMRRAGGRGDVQKRGVRWSIPTPLSSFPETWELGISPVCQGHSAWSHLQDCR